MRHALRSAGADLDVIDRVELAVAEACNNAILHAQGDTFSITVAVDGDRARVDVADDGPGFAPPVQPAMPPALATGHRGLPLMRALVDEVEVTSGRGGTVVALGQDLSAGHDRAHLVADR